MSKMFSDFIERFKNQIPKVNTVKNLEVGKNTLVVFVDGENFKTEVADVCKAHGGVVTKAIEAKPFEGKNGEILSIFPANLNGGNFSRILVVSLGKLSELNAQKDKYWKLSLQNLGGKISGLLNGAKVDEVSLHFTFNHQKLSCIINQITYGIVLKNYRFDKFFVKKAEGKAPCLKNIHVSSVHEAVELGAKLNKYGHIAENMYLIRELVNMPPADLNPEYYADLINSAFEHGILSDLFSREHVTVNTLDEDEMRSLNMNGVLAVGAGSSKASRVVVIEYKGDPSREGFDVAFVGKGVCFDSGGLSIKPAQSMEDMKCDMGGSALMFATIRLLAQQKEKINVVATLGIVENAVDANSYRPGDIITTMSGQTIEVLNTDAEGRIVLADCLYYTQKIYKPKFMIDAATLTGAITVALGDVYAGLFSTDDEITGLIEESALKASEKLWAFPMEKEFDDMIDSTVADVKNIGSGRGAGSITAAQFLGRFVNCDEDTPKTKWAHLDIAGVAFLGKSGTPTSDKGATGWGLMTMYKFARMVGKK